MTKLLKSPSMVLRNKTVVNKNYKAFRQGESLSSSDSSDMSVIVERGLTKRDLKRENKYIKIHKNAVRLLGELNVNLDKIDELYKIK